MLYRNIAQGNSIKSTIPIEICTPNAMDNISENHTEKSNYTENLLNHTEKLYKR